MNLKSISSKILLILCSIGAAFTACELFTRWVLGETTSVYYFHEGNFLKKKSHLVFKNELENENLVILNNFGFHDKERSSVTSAYRVLVLGDSFVEGLQVPRSRLFTSIMESHFESRKCPPLEVMNAGVSGTGTVNQYLLWKHFIENKIEYDHIVLFMYMGNDLQNNNLKLSYPETSNINFVDKTGAIIFNEVKEGFLKTTIKAMRNYSAFINYSYIRIYLLEKHFKNKAVKREKAPNQHKSPSPHSKPKVSQMKSLLDSSLLNARKGTTSLIKKWISELPFGVSFDIVFLDGVGAARNQPQIKLFLQDVFALTEELDIHAKEIQFDVPHEEIYFFVNGKQGHLNVKGHELVGKDIVNWLEKDHSLCRE